jgi:leucyl/phenylalanyl-tRNA--protein transferase
MPALSPEDLLYGYSNGIFPMADDGEIYWYSPDPRAIIPLENYKPSKSLRPILNKKLFEIKFDADFEGVMRKCALPRFDGDGVWISEDIVSSYVKLHELGFAHSVEAYFDGKLVGGLYGVALGSVFFGESMFYTMANASKVAFHYLIENLQNRNFKLLDTQFINDNVIRFGAIEIPKKEFMKQLKASIGVKNTFC